MHRHFGFHPHHQHRERGMRGGFGRGGFGGHERHGRRGGGGRFFDQGDLRLVILSLLADAPGHGYQIIKTLEERTGGAYAPSPGVVYPTLTMLEEQGLIEQAGADGAKKLYSVTEAGREALAAEAASLEAIKARFREAGERGVGFSPKLLRARENLRTALKLKLMQGPLTEAQVEAVVEALDQAAKAVEAA